MNVKVTYFLDVTSSWCYWAESAWAEIKKRFSLQPVDFLCNIALLNQPAMPVSREQLEWFYRRSGSVVRSPFMLNSGWYEPGQKEYLAPNCVVEAAKDFGVEDDRVRLALATAALREGQKILQWKTACGVAAKAAGLNLNNLLAQAQSPQTEKRVRAASAQFHALQVTERPTFFCKATSATAPSFRDWSLPAPSSPPLRRCSATPPPTLPTRPISEPLHRNER